MLEIDVGGGKKIILVPTPATPKPGSTATQSTHRPASSTPPPGPVGTSAGKATPAATQPTPTITPPSGTGHGLVDPGSTALPGAPTAPAASAPPPPPPSGGPSTGTGGTPSPTDPTLRLRPPPPPASGPLPGPLILTTPTPTEGGDTWAPQAGGGTPGTNLPPTTLARGLVDVSTQSVAPPTTAETGVKIVVPVDYTPPPSPLRAPAASSKTPPLAGTRQLASSRLTPIITFPPSPNPGPLAISAFQAFASRLGLTATRAEIEYALRPGNIPRAAPTLVLAATLFTFEVAIAQNTKWWGTNSGRLDLTNGAPDAFLHAAYSGLLTLRFGKSYAEQLTTRHETGTPQQTRLERNARTMDLHNNQVGIALAESISKSPPPDVLHFQSYAGIAKNNSEAELMTVILDASRPKTDFDIGLVTLGPPGAAQAQVRRDPTIYSIASGRPIRVR